MRLAVAAIKAEGGPRSIDPRAFVCVFTADEAAHLELHVPAPARAYDRRTALDRWAHPAFTHLRELSVATREVLGRAIFKGSLTVAKKRYEHGSAERMLLGPGESGGRYRCVAPERLLRDGYPQLMSEADVETLKRDRIVVVDHAIPPEVLALARAEALRMDAQGALAGEKNSTCNPGERSTEMALYEEAHLGRLRQQHPGLHDCVRSLWNLPALLGPRLGLAVRVPQTVLLASYPPGALYHRHYDSYDGKDIPRLLTVLLYLAYEPQKGGELRALNCPNRDPPEWDIAPVPGRLCVFYAQEIEHMVLESTGHRMALTLWIWDQKKDTSGR